MLLITLLIFTQRDFNDNITALRFRSIIWLLHVRTISRQNRFYWNDCPKIAHFVVNNRRNQFPQKDTKVLRG